MRIGNNYVVVLVDTQEKATAINRAASSTREGETKVEAFSSMSQMVGIRHRATRPTLIIDAIKDREVKNFERWFDSEVRRNAVNAKYVSVY